jgi:hypothetical protein
MVVFTIHYEFSGQKSPLIDSKPIVQTAVNFIPQELETPCVNDSTTGTLTHA